MMMAATRRSASSLGRRGKSPKSKKRSSRKASHDDDTERDRTASRMDLDDSGRMTRLEQRPPRSPSRNDRAESRLDFGHKERVGRSDERKSGSESKDRYNATSRHAGDVADSGIDSGNGVAELDSSLGRLRRSSSSDHIDDRHASLHPDGEKKDQPAVTVTVTDHSAKPDSPRASRKRRKSKHKRDRQSASAEEADPSPAVAKTPLPTNADKFSGMSESTTDMENKETSDGSTIETPVKAKPKSGEEKREEDKSGEGDSMVVSAQAMEKKKKLEARLEQAKHSLESPHVNAAVDAFEMAEGPLVSPPNTGLLQEFRRLFQQELTRLRMELDTFRRFCSKQMEVEAAMLGAEGGGEKTSGSATVTKDEEERQKASQADEDIKRREERLAERVQDLQEYEKEILEVESMLNQRQAICERRQSALLTLDEELHSLREDIFNKKENLREEGDTSAERARKHWDFVRRHLTDKQAMLEATIQRFRTQLAAANASLAAKDSLIAHLQKQVKEGQESLRTKDKKLQQLEEKLVLLTEEMHQHTLPSTTTSNDPQPHSRPQSRAGSVRPPSSLQRQGSQSPERNRSKSVPGMGRRLSTHHPDGPLVPTATGRRMSTHHPDIPVTFKNSAESGHRESLKGRAAGGGGGDDAAGNGVHVWRGEGGEENAVSRDVSARRRQYQRSRSTPHSMINSATNASAACAIL